MSLNSICDVPGIKVGHAQNKQAKTGCTVILTPENGAVAAVDVRGSAPGTREIELLYPTRLVTKVDAILLTGGSAFGLDAAGGVQQFLEQQGRGYDTGIAKVPIVPAAVIFDLAVSDPYIRPDKKMGYEAANNARVKNNDNGAVGAGIGATVGKFAGQQYAMNGGVGGSSINVTQYVVLGVIVVVNALGNIFDCQTNKTIAGAWDAENELFFDPVKVLQNNRSFRSFTNTTLAVVAMNASLNRDELTKIAQMANDGLARAINPAHTQYDGDIVFAISTCTENFVEPLLLGTLAADLVSQAIVNAVKISNKL